MSQETWTAVDDYVAGLLAPHDEALEAALRASEDAGLPAIQVSPAQGKLLYLLAKSIGARQILEFGTLGGYSTIWLARALPAGGRLITLEAEPLNAEVAGRNIDRAGLGDLVDLCVGPALDQLPQLEAEGAGPFDLTFIDADKIHTPDYFAWALDRSRPGSLILSDNVVRFGGSRTLTATTRRSRRSVTSTRCLPLSRGSRRRRFRPLAPRATTDSPLHLSLPDRPSS